MTDALSQAGMLHVFKLPDFDSDRPFSLVNAAFSSPAHVRPAWIDKRCGENEERDESLELRQRVLGEDGVLDRFVNKNGTEEEKTLLVESIEVDRPFDILRYEQGSAESKATEDWPRALEDLEDGADFELYNFSHLHLQSHARKADEKVLVKLIRANEFEAEEAKSDETESTYGDLTIESRSSARPCTSLIHSLVLTACGHTSRHFRWMEDTMQFVERKEAIDSTNNFTQLSPTAFASITARFRNIGALQRRLYWRVQDIRAKARSNVRDPERSASFAAEDFSLASGLSDILAWFSADLEQQDFVSSEDRGKGLLHLWGQLEEREEVVQGLARLFKCTMDESLPFSNLFESSNNSKQTAKAMTMVHTQLIASIESCASSRLVDCFHFLMEVTSKSWRAQLANWIGWPCSSADFIADEVETKMTLGREARKSRGGERYVKSGTDRCEPWAGMEVEWGWDDRGELDVGYILRPVRLPSFLPISYARDLLEAGRALRLLQRAAPMGHPMLMARERRRSDEKNVRTGHRALPIPTWTRSSKDTDEQLSVTVKSIREFRREIGAWRRYKSQSQVGPTRMQERDIIDIRPVTASIPSVSQMRACDASERSFSYAALVGSYEQTMNLFNQLPTTVERASSNADALRFQRYLDDISEAKLCGPGGRSIRQNATLASSFLAPMQRWAKLVNASLISVFFRDLFLGEYLDVCQQFLLLGDPNFATMVAEVLFTAEDADHSVPAREQVKGVKTDTFLAAGVGLSKLLRADASWPPSGSGFSSALNTTVLEGVSQCRVRTERTGRRERRLREKIGGKSGKAVRTALLDLDDRLSFAIVGAQTKKPAAWHDRKSIEALDWLNLTFQPPTLIAPLITLQTQLYYQRLFTHLLRLMRVEVVLKSIQRTIVSRPTKGDASSLLPIWMDRWDLERALRFRYEANHFVSVLYRHSTDVVISQRWRSFRSRLNALCRSAESQDDLDELDDDVDVRSEQECSENESSDEYDDVESLVDSISEIEGGSSMSAVYDAMTEVEKRGDDGEETTERFELKDVFSIAVYHERTLDRMLSGCFLKTRQKSIMTIIMDMLNLILAFGQLLTTTTTTTKGETEAYDDTLFEAGTRLEELLARFQSKRRLLLHALDLIGQRAMQHQRGDGKAMHLIGETAKSSSSTATNSKSKRRHGRGDSEQSSASSARHAAVDAEIARQEQETRRDLEQLENDDRQESMRDVEMLEALVVALRGDDAVQ